MEAKAASHSRLPCAYQAVDVNVCNEPLSVHLDITRWMANEERRLGYRPVTLFRNVVEYPTLPILGNPYPRSVVLSALGVDRNNWQQEIFERLNGVAPSPRTSTDLPGSWTTLSGLGALPALWHRPGDAGRYITAGVTVSKSLSTGRTNFGVYRIQIVNDTKGRIFFDPRTDAYRNWQEAIRDGKSLPVAIFLGAHPVYLLVAASRLIGDEDDVNIAALLSGANLEVAGELSVPTESSYVIYGEVTGDLETEGPFAEFKGYYVEARQSPVLRVQRVMVSPTPIYPAIVTGAESGLTLMALQNEYLLYSHLRKSGYAVRRVRFLLEGRGEFVALIESEDLSTKLLRSAMDFDPRCKVMICGSHLEQPWNSIATHGMRVCNAPYYRKGKVDGERVGLLLDLPPLGRPVEY